MVFYSTTTALTTLTFLWSMIHTTDAVNINLYNGANCGGSINAVCSGIQSGRCCSNSLKLWGSVQAVNSPCVSLGSLVTFGTVGQGLGTANNGCNVILGRGSPCYSTALNRVQGGFWTTASSCPSDSSTPIARDIEDEMLLSFNNTECQEVDLLNYEENGTNYQLYTNGSKYAELIASEAATNDDVMGKFIKENADKIMEAGS